MSLRVYTILGMRPFFVLLSLLTSNTVHNMLCIKASGTNTDKGKSKNTLKSKVLLSFKIYMQIIMEYLLSY